MQRIDPHSDKPRRLNITMPRNLYEDFKCFIEQNDEFTSMSEYIRTMIEDSIYETK